MIYLILVLVLAPLVVSLYARGRFQSVYEQTREVEGIPTLTGAGVARKILESEGLEDVEIVEHWGLFSDYYDPSRKRLALSRPHFRGTNAAAYGIAAHEAGHALQDKARFGPLKARIAAIKLSQYLSPLVFLLPAVAIFAKIGSVKITLLIMFASWALLLAYNLSTMPVEVDATQRANEVLRRLRVFRNHEQEKATFRMAKAAGLMYVSGFLNTVKWLLASLLPRRKK